MSRPKKRYKCAGCNGTMVEPKCREIAWNEIKDRKGKMVDGVFVKEVQGE